MKKLVMVMCFALCASLAFAQPKSAPHRVSNPHQIKAMKSGSTEVQHAKKDYKASIFGSKAGGDVIHHWQFAETSNDYTTGTISTSGQTVINESGSQQTLLQHTNTASYAHWNRIPDYSDATIAYYEGLTVEQGGYPAYFYAFGNTMPFSLMEDAETGDNGWMLMSMIDNYTTWGGDGATGNFDAYIALNPISTEGIGLLYLNFFQLYRAFYDECYIDYSSNGTTWYTMEINVKGVDINVNANTFGEKVNLLPASCGNQANLSLRIRYESTGASGGYFWWIDDAKAVEADENVLNHLTSSYYYGYYHQVPEGFEVPVAWFASIQNGGSHNQPQVTMSLNHLNSDQSVSSQFASLTYGPLNSGYKKDTMISSLGISFTGVDNWIFCVGDSLAANTPAAKLPSTTVGDNYIYPGYEATNVSTKYGDTILYMVNSLQAAPDGNGQVAVWAQDNGILTPYAYCVDGLIESNGTWYLSTGIGDDNPSYTKPGYDMWNRFVTGANVPDGWAIRGVQLVAATQYSATDPSSNISLMPGAKITASLYMDSIDGFFDTGIETGAATYETTVADYNYFEGDDMSRVTRTSAGDNYKEYMMPGEYAVINMMFPEQPDLLPNTSYKLGYELIEGYFAVASQSTRYVHHYEGDPDTTLYWVYYSSDTLKDGSPNVLRKYGRYFGDGNQQNHWSYDPDHGTARDVTGRVPMIRMLVGPKFQYPTFNVSVTCEGNGVDLADLLGSGVFYLSGGNTSVCGETVEMTQGSTGSYTVSEAEPGYMIDEVWVNDVMVYKHGGTMDDNVSRRVTTEGYELVYYDFSSYTTDATIKYIFAVDDGPVTYTITANSNNPAWGTVSGGDEYEEGAIATLRANPNAGYCFVQWQDGNTDNPRSFTVTSNATYTATFEPCTGINEASSNVSMSLYPNPANNSVKLNIAGVSGNVTCTVLDMSGRVVYSKTINAEEATTINVSNFAKGAYFVRVTNNEFTKVEKLVVR
ncbi:MAG: T9SS type A sorting domain-containing protein [Bacteroidales bacterium]|nr:T9SS type A sorting domain-containing protein [Bacteroidales bacterium]